MSIQETTLGPRQYLTLRKKIATNAIADTAMYEQAGQHLGAYIQANGVSVAGPWSVLYFVWDEPANKAEIGICFPVEGVAQVNDPQLSLVTLPKTKAVMTALHGPYQGLGNTHQSLMRYIIERKLDNKGLPVLAVEEYIVNPMSEPNPENYVTNVYYLYK